jgi:uncharacterized protein (TIGR03083 family)
VRGTAISEAARARTADIVASLRDTELSTPSKLEGWTRLTVACHLRYGAAASDRMTADALAGVETSFYPDGRSGQRPGTLEPGRGEEPQQVVDSLEAHSARLHDSWGRMSETEWATAIREPPDNPDLGETTVAELALLRLTEAEIHGCDLDLGLGDWSDMFVTNALPLRIGRLASRRSKLRAAGSGVRGSWILVATDGPSWRISLRGEEVSCEPADGSEPADAVIEATSRDLLALLLGRQLKDGLVERGDTRFAGEFSKAFPGP